MGEGAAGRSSGGADERESDDRSPTGSSRVYCTPEACSPSQRSSGRRRISLAMIIAARRRGGRAWRGVRRRRAMPVRLALDAGRGMRWRRPGGRTFAAGVPHPLVGLGDVGAEGLGVLRDALHVRLRRCEPTRWRRQGCRDSASVSVTGCGGAARGACVRPVGAAVARAARRRGRLADGAAARSGVVGGRCCGRCGCALGCCGWPPWARRRNSSTSRRRVSSSVGWLAGRGVAGATLRAPPAAGSCGGMTGLRARGGRLALLLLHVADQVGDAVEHDEDDRERRLLSDVAEVGQRE